MKQPNIRKYLLSLFLVLAITVALAFPIVAATTADVVITVTLANVSISDNQTSYDFGVVNAGSSTNTSLTQVAVTNTSTVQTDITIAVTSANWTGGTPDWVHSDTATAGADVIGLRAGKTGGTVSDVIVKFATPNYLYENCPASTNFTYGMQLLAPTSDTAGVQKTNTVQISAVQG